MRRAFPTDEGQPDERRNETNQDPVPRPRRRRQRCGFADCQRSGKEASQEGEQSVEGGNIHAVADVDNTRHQGTASGASVENRLYAQRWDDVLACRPPTGKAKAKAKAVYGHPFQRNPSA